MPNYYDMSAGDQQTTSAGIPPGPTARQPRQQGGTPAAPQAQTTGTIGATTTEAQAASDVQRLHKYKLPPPYFNGDYSNYDAWRFKLQANLGLIDNEFDQILRAADVATSTVVDQHLINEVQPDTARGNKLSILHVIYTTSSSASVKAPQLQWLDKAATQPMVAKHYNF